VLGYADAGPLADQNLTPVIREDRSDLRGSVLPAYPSRLLTWPLRDRVGSIREYLRAVRARRGQ